MFDRCIEWKARMDSSGVTAKRAPRGRRWIALEAGCGLGAALRVRRSGRRPPHTSGRRTLLSRRRNLMERSGRSVWGVHARTAVVAVPAQRRARDVETAARVVDRRDELANRPRKRFSPAVLAERVGEPEHRALDV